MNRKLISSSSLKIKTKMYWMNIFIVSAILLGSSTSAIITGNNEAQENLEKIFGDITGTAPKGFFYPTMQESSNLLYLSNDTFYAYNTVDVYGGTPQGPICFNSDSPDDITLIAQTISPDFIAGACWVEGKGWYGTQYLNDYDGGLWYIDEISGRMTFIGRTSGISMNALAYDDASGAMYGTSGTSLYIINMTTGAATLVGSTGISDTIIGIACDGYGAMYATTVSFTNMANLWSIDMTTGVATVIGSTGRYLLYAQDMAFDKNNGILYHAAFFGDGTPPGLYTIDTSSGIMTHIGNFMNGMEVTGFAIPYYLGSPEHDLGVSAISKPISDLASTQTPEISIKNYGMNSETDIPINMKIGYKNIITHFSEDFEDPNALNNWTTVQYGAGNAQWDCTAYGTHDNEPPGSGDYYLDGWDQPYENWNTSIFTPAIDLTGVTKATLTFQRNFQKYGYYGEGKFRIYSGGISQSNLEAEPILLVKNDPYSGFFTEIFFNPSTYTDPSQVFLEFYYNDGGYYFETRGLAIDDIELISFDWTNEYNHTINVDLPLNITLDFSFPDWTPLAFHVQENVDIDYQAEVHILYDDNKSYNNYETKEFTLHFGFLHDLTVNAILSPSSGQASTFYPEIQVKNIGQNDEHNVDVNLKIEKIIDTIYNPPFWRQVQYSGYGLWDQSPYGTHNYEPQGDGSYYAEAWDTSGIQFDVGLFTFPLDFSGLSKVTLTFNRNFQDYYGYGQAKVRTYSGGYNSSNWEEDLLYLDNDDPSTGVFTVLNFDPSTYTDPSEVYIEWWYYDDSYTSTTYGFCIDDVTVMTVGYTEGFENYFPPSTPVYVEEYNVTKKVSINMGEMEDIIYPEWIPGDMDFGDINYRITASTELPTDGNISNDQFYSIINLLYIHDVCVVEITEPAGFTNREDWLYYHTGFSNNAVGRTTAGTFYTAIRFSPTELAPYDGQKLTMLRFYDYEGTALTCRAKIYGDGPDDYTPGELLHEQIFTSGVGYWHDIQLTSTLPIDATGDLWISIEFDQTMQMYPLGVDAGPAVNSKGGLVSNDGITWEDISQYGLNYNWCIEAYVIDYLEPGTFPVSGIIKNSGTYTEGQFNVNAKIWRLGMDGTKTLFYEDNATSPTLLEGESTTIVFNDVTFTDDDEGSYRIDMETNLVGDERQNNDMKTLYFVVLEPDTVPPQTTHTFNGIVGDNEWYVSDLTVTLDAEDFSYVFKSKGPPSGVQNTWYRINGEDWNEYTGPFNFSNDGEYELEYYSIDNDGNIEDIQGPFDFKIDQTVPVIVNVTVEKVSFTLYKISALVEDVTSGIARVEFFRDDSLLGNVTTEPWEWEYTASTGSHVVNIVVYDHAGNQEVSEYIESTSVDVSNLVKISQYIHNYFVYS